MSDGIQRWGGVALLLAVVAGLPACQGPRVTRTLPESSSASASVGQSYLEEARVLIAQGEDDAALATLTLAIQENPRLTEAYLTIASIHERKGDYVLAEERYNQAARLEPNNFEAQYGSALAKHLSGKVREAVRAYLRALSLVPDSFKANRDLSAAYIQLGQPAQALPYAMRSTRLDPDSQPAWSNLAVAYAMQSRWDGAIGAYRQAAELGDLQDPVLLGLAEAHIRMGNFGRAINTLETLLRRSPSATAHERMGYANFKLRRFEQALRHYDTALELDASDLAALNGKGVCHVTLFIEGRYENPYHKVKGVEAWRQSLALNPDQPRIVDLLARYGQK